MNRKVRAATATRVPKVMALFVITSSIVITPCCLRSGCAGWNWGS